MRDSDDFDSIYSSKKMKKKILRIFKSFGVTLLTIILIVFLFLQFSPQFGGAVPKAQQTAFAKTGHFGEGIFTNKEPLHFEMNCHSIEKMVSGMANPHPNLVPKNDLEVIKVTAEEINAHTDTTIQVIWFGHSTFLLKVDGKLILLDPVFSQYAAPHAMLGRKRFNSQMPIDIEELPEIDMVLISHDHYDHLDYESIVKLKDKTKKFCVPLGVGSHLVSWKVDEDKIMEMDWWEEQNMSGITVAFTPSRHTSGRGLGDQNATLWGSWILKGKEKNVFYSGDGGYGSHFKEIGNKYGPFDIGIMECGQYNELWRDMHMMPKETVKAGMDVQAKVIVPAHWGAFALGMHSWKEPVERATKEAARLGLPMATPRLGESISIGQGTLSTTQWWTEIE